RNPHRRVGNRLYSFFHHRDGGPAGASAVTRPFRDRLLSASTAGFSLFRPVSREVSSVVSIGYQDGEVVVIVVCYADDLVAGFEHEDDARRFLDAMRERFAAFSLSLHPGKTRVIEFGRHAAVNRKKRVSINRRPSRSWASPSSAVNRAGYLSNFSGGPGATECERSSRKSRRSCGCECTRLSQIRVTC